MAELRSGRGGAFIAERGGRMADRIRVNERIRAREVRLIDEEGNQLGVVTLFDAMKNEIRLAISSATDFGY